MRWALLLLLAGCATTDGARGYSVTPTVEVRVMKKDKPKPQPYKKVLPST